MVIRGGVGVVNGRWVRDKSVSEIVLERPQCLYIMLGEARYLVRKIVSLSVEYKTMFAPISEAFAVASWQRTCCILRGR